MDIYKGVCLSLTNDIGALTAILCTDRSYGFDGNIGFGIDPSTDAEQDIVFQATFVTGTPNIVSAQLYFDTSATGSNLQVNDKLKIAQVTIDSFFPEE